VLELWLCWQVTLSSGASLNEGAWGGGNTHASDAKTRMRLNLFAMTSPKARLSYAKTTVRTALSIARQP
jgi:hypothetical protein